jgi:hypothetical protein
MTRIALLSKNSSQRNFIVDWLFLNHFTDNISLKVDIAIKLQLLIVEFSDGRAGRKGFECGGIEKC